MKIERVSTETLVLEEEGHRYFLGEGLERREVPSYSHVMAAVGLATDYSKIDPDILTFRAAVGNATHRAIRDILSGYSPEVALSDAEPVVEEFSEPHVNAFLEFQRQNKLVPSFLEVPTYNPVLKYACTADFVGTCDDLPTVLDWKTTSRISKTVALQTMGQRLCFKIMDYGVTFPLGSMQRGAVHLKKDGTFRVVWHTDHEQNIEDLIHAAGTYAAQGRYLGRTV